jgi:hypothetical protein
VLTHKPCIAAVPVESVKDIYKTTKEKCVRTLSIVSFIYVILTLVATFVRR